MTSPAPSDPTPAAVADLAERLAVEADRISVESVETVTWRDSSLGCPQPGMMYATVLTPGHRVLLRVDEQTYEYHSGGERGPVLCECEDPEREAPQRE